MGKRILILLTLCIFFERIFSQQLPFGHLSIENGLSNNIVNCLLQDHLGFLWYGTEDGLNRYDGYEVKVYKNNPNDSNSISDNSIWAIYEDHSGALWVGTNSGELDKYDCLNDKFIHLKIESKNSKQNRITAIYEDKEGFLWIGTYKDGLYRYNFATKKFDHWQNQHADSQSLCYNYVTSIIEDCFGNIWVSTYNGLNKYNSKSPDKPFTRFFSDRENPNSLSSNLIWSLTKSDIDSNVIWICAVNGVTKYDAAKSTFSRVELQNEHRIQFGNSAGRVAEEIIENENILWIATYGGLVRINFSTGRQTRFITDNHNPLEISSNYINTCLIDRSGVLWLATDNGLSYLSPKNIKFNYFFSKVIQNKYSRILNEINIKAITQTINGYLWFGTEEGLYFSKDFDKTGDIVLPPNLENLNVWSLASDCSGNLWIGTYGQGIKQYNVNSGLLKSWNIEDPASKFKNQSFKFVKSILQDKKGMLWFGFWGPGITRLNPETGEYKNWQNKENDPLSISYNDIWTIFQDSKNRIWIGTNGGGLNLFDVTDGGRFYCWSRDKNPFSSENPKDKNSLENTNLMGNSIYSICEASKGRFASSNKQTVLWIGTSAGLNQFIIMENRDIVKNNNFDLHNIKIKLQSFTMKEGLPDNAIQSITEDENGNLWLGTNNGISFFNLEKNTFTNFSSSDGLNGNEFNSGSTFNTSKGLMILGSTKGLNIFNPARIKRSDFTPSVFITRFQIFNQDVLISNNSPLKEAVILAKEIVLSYDQNVFSFQFSSLDYNSPGSNKYTYKMEGFDKSWIFCGSRRFVTYTNLDPGSYIFKVKATNSDGIWSKNEASLRVIINPPWWRTIWAYALYIFLAGFGLIVIRKFQINRTELRNELRMREFEAKKLQELENLKSRFFANLSHEFRTPLMLIKGPVEQLINKWKDQNKKEETEQLKMVHRSSSKLQELIDQLLELSQIESASIPLKVQKEDLIPLLRGIVYSFESLAVQKNIKLIFNSTEEYLCVCIDRDKLEKIINNLLSNAFKFNNEEGRVTVSVTINKSSGEAEVKISDTGIGIHADHIEKIFDRFYQVDDSSRKVFAGSGIGLALVKELVELHKWKISVKSEPGKGTEFTLLIPVETEYSKGREKNIKTINIEKIIQEEMKPLKQNLSAPHGVPGGIVKKVSILIVEDSSDVRKYLSDLLSSQTYETYASLTDTKILTKANILEAENGESGLKLAAEKMPDLIISDIMMPHMDGLEFCQRIKSNWETSHIPVVLLTAKASGENRIEGLETGADDYLTKPFSSKELFVRIKNLLEQRSRLKEKFSKEIKVNPESIAATSLDGEFLNRAFKVAEKNLGNPDFDSESFAKEMFVSRSQLHRKLIGITGFAPGEFLRSFRLKRAAQMLLEKQLSVTQIAFEIGFSSPSHFTKAFHQQFNCLPSEFSSKFKYSL